MANLDNLNLRGFAIQSISPLDPSGWLRVTLARAQNCTGGNGCRAAPAVAEPVQTNPVAAEAVQVPATTVLARAGPSPWCNDTDSLIRTKPETNKAHRSPAAMTGGLPF